jgi:hypothetical protein
MNYEAQILHEIAEKQQTIIGFQGFLTRTVAQGYDMANSPWPGDNVGPGKLDSGVDAPWISPPHGAVSFFPKTQVAIPAVGGTSTILTMQVPNGSDGAIQKFSVNYVGGGFVNGSGDIVWRILANGKAIRNANNIISEMGTQDSPFELSSTIRIYSGQTITVEVNHVANAALNQSVLAMLEGWFYPARGG